MRNHHLAHVLVAVLTAGTLACSAPNGSPRKNEQRGGARGTQDRVALKGCVQGGAGNTYELRHIVELPPERQPQGQGSASRAPLPAGSWVRLTSGSDLKPYLGQQVTIQGWIAETGEGTMGTMGRTDPGASGESKTAQSTQPGVVAPGGALANGNAPSVAVEHVTGQGACTATP
jgi:hypothetical protein